MNSVCRHIWTSYNLTLMLNVMGISRQGVVTDVSPYSITVQHKCDPYKVHTLLPLLLFVWNHVT